MENYELLTSRQNPKIRAAAELLTTAGRKAAGAFLIEGARLCADAAENNVEIIECFFTDNAALKFGAELGKVIRAAHSVFRISESVSEKLSDTRTPQGIYCVCPIRSAQVGFAPDGFYVMTDNIQNPDNLGAIARTAEALGAAGMIVSGGCDIYAPKALRASMGALLRFPVIYTDEPVSTLEKLKTQGFSVYAAALRRDALDLTAVPKNGGNVVIVGNEGSGVGETLLNVCDKTILIPMAGLAQSLNAAAAAAILIWEFTKEKQTGG